MMYQAEIEAMPLPQLRQLQDARLRQLVDYLYARVPFYRDQWDAAGVRPADIRGVADLARLPFTHKSDLRDQYPFGLLAVPMEEVNRIHASSGTTGKPTVVGYTRADIDLFAEVCARSLYAAGARPGMKLHNAYGYGLFTGGLGMHYGGERLGMAVVPVSGGMTERQLTLLQDFAPEVICCTPSYALTLAGEIRARGIDPSSLAVRYAVLGAEPWTEAVRAEVEAGLGVTATNIYGLSEIIGPGVSQEDHLERHGSHIWEDHFFPEIVDPKTGAPLPEGQDGVLVFTTLTKQAMPLMRYWTNDITHLYYDSDARRTHVKMGPIKGRADDMLIIRGVNLFPSQVEEVLGEVAELSSHYQLVLRKKGAMDSVLVRVEPTETVAMALDDQAETAHRQWAGKLRERIKGTIGLSMDIEILPPGGVPRSTGGKLARVKDERGL
ncbi:MAG: phenylacetate--CoA ligase [Bacteroidetes bacterium]|nr:MAG: phenylacetate--CoA ligase [Bacteroidota bacterium]